MEREKIIELKNCLSSNRLTQTYSDNSYGVAIDLPMGENSHDFKYALIDKLGVIEELALPYIKELEEENETLKEYKKANEAVRKADKLIEDFSKTYTE